MIGVDAQPTLDPIQLMLNVGIAGVVVVLLLVGWLWAKPSVQREFAKADAQQARQQETIDTLLAAQQAMLPVLVEVNKRLIPLMESTQHMLKRVEALLDRVEHDWRSNAPETRYGSRREADAGRGGGGGYQGPGTDDRPSDQGRA